MTLLCFALLEAKPVRTDLAQSCVLNMIPMSGGRKDGNEKLVEETR